MLADTKQAGPDPNEKRDEQACKDAEQCQRSFVGLLQNAFGMRDQTQLPQSRKLNFESLAAHAPLLAVPVAEHARPADTKQAAPAPNEKRDEQACKDAEQCQRSFVGLLQNAFGMRDQTQLPKAF